MVGDNFILFVKKYIKPIILLILILTFLIVIFALNNTKDVIMTVGDKEFTTEDYYMYLYSSKYKLYQDNASNISDEELNKEYSDGLTLKEYLHKKTNNELTIAGIVKIMAQDNEIELSKSDKEEIEAQKQQFISTLGGQDKFIDTLKENKTSLKAYDRMLETDALYSLILKKLYSKGQIKDLSKDEKEDGKTEYENTYFKVNQIVISKLDLNTQKSLTKKEINQKRDLINVVLSKAKSGIDFDTLINDYSDISKEDTYFSKEDIEEDIYNKIKGLQIGEVSDVIETDNSFRIIKRVKLDDKYLDSYYDTLRDNKLLTDIATLQDSIKIKYSKEFYKLK